MHPETGEVIGPLALFLRALHRQRAAHAATGTPYAISQEIIADKCPDPPAPAPGGAVAANPGPAAA